MILELMIPTATPEPVDLDELVESFFRRSFLSSWMHRVSIIGSIGPLQWVPALSHWIPGIRWESSVSFELQNHDDDYGAFGWGTASEGSWRGDLIDHVLGEFVGYTGPRPGVLGVVLSAEGGGNSPLLLSSLVAEYARLYPEALCAIETEPVISVFTFGEGWTRDIDGPRT